MKNANLKLFGHILLLNIFLLNIGFISPEKQVSNYCRETGQTEKEIAEIDKKADKDTEKNSKSYFPLRCIKYFNDILNLPVFNTDHLNCCLLNTSFCKYIVTKESSERAPPFKD